MNLTETEVGNVLTLAPSGPLSEGTAPGLVPRVERALEAAQLRVLLDFTKVTSVDSVGLEVIVSLARKVYRASGRLGLFGLSSVLQDVFRVTRLNQRLVVFETREDALARMRTED